MSEITYGEPATRATDARLRAQERIADDLKRLLPTSINNEDGRAFCDAIAGHIVRNSGVTFVNPD